MAGGPEGRRGREGGEGGRHHQELSEVDTESSIVGSDRPRHFASQLVGAAAAARKRWNHTQYRPGGCPSTHACNHDAAPASARAHRSIPAAAHSSSSSSNSIRRGPTCHFRPHRRLKASQKSPRPSGSAPSTGGSPSARWPRWCHCRPHRTSRMPACGVHASGAMARRRAANGERKKRRARAREQSET